ncbi:MAG: DUF4176 domain-containing protein [Streptococcaceae bacterium]|jgi:hypothetical protein|nr:DUF4176 domain-containing protein [Streptococcaceae bacterium]
MENNSAKSLPIGTVVTLKGSNQNLVIISLLPVAEIKGEKGYFEFGAATLPTGLASEDLIFFNRENIENIIYLGYVDARFQEFMGHYDEIISKVEYKRMAINGILED